MSANNVWIIDKVGDKYYGWDETAEEVVPDEETNHERHLSIKGAFSGKTAEEVETAMEKSYEEFGYLLSPEYGIIGATRLPKDGTPIKIIEANNKAKGESNA